MKQKRKLPPSVRKWGWRASYNGVVGTIFASDRRDISPYVFFADDDDNTAHPVQDSDFRRLDNERGESDLDLLLLGGLICTLIIILGGLWMDGTIRFEPWEFIRYTIETAGR